MRRTKPKFYDDIDDLVQCQECKKWYRTLYSHLPRIHKISCEQYKDKYLLFNGDLCNQETRLKISKFQKQPDVLFRTKERFFKNVQPQKGKISTPPKKERYLMISGLDLGKKFCHTKEALKKLSLSLKKAHQEGRMNKSYTSKRNGKEYNCWVCGKIYYRSKVWKDITKFCSKKCSAQSDYTKGKIKEFWKSDRAKIEKKRRKRLRKKEWETGKRKGGWKWSKKLKK